MTLTLQNAQDFGEAIECIFYGAYVVLFILYLVLRRRNSCRFGGPLTLAQVLLFGLCTLSTFIHVTEDYLFIIPDAKELATADKIRLGSPVIFAIIDYLSQMILVCRCWIVWDKRWAVVAVPGFLAFITLGGGFALFGLLNSPLWGAAGDPEKVARIFRSTGAVKNSISLVANALTTSLIVTKILLTSREVSPTLGSNSHPSLRLVTATLIESGLLMFSFQVVYVVLFSLQHPATDIIAGPIIQIYGITPTLLNIRVVMGSAYNKTTVEARSLGFARMEEAATQTTSPSIGTAGVQSRGIDAGLDCASNNGGIVDNSA
ncbi:hypothetical protein BD779DRAFT_1675423 [Infundibulicybe gibba]|nr:hypothetical protein BD779DRAFT_1675423 [Infundibulicybe gibba]